MELLESVGTSLSLIFLLVAAVLLWFVYKQYQFRVLKLPPGPLGLPILGYVASNPKAPDKEFDQLSKKYGPLFSLKLGTYQVVVVSDYEYAKEMLNHPAALGRPDKLLDFLPASGGFLGMNGAPWQEQRRFCIHSMRNLGLGKGPWEKIIEEDVAEFVRFLQKCQGRPIDISGPLTRSGTSNNTALLIGQRFTKKKTNPDVKLIEEAHYVLTEHANITNPALLMPWLLKFFVKFNINGYAHKMKVIDNFCDIFRREIKKRQDSSDNTIDSTDFIGYYLDAMNKKSSTDDNSYYSVENLVGNMTVLFFAGSDTTIASINWLLVLMASYPEVQKKVQDELDDVIGRDGCAGWDNRKKLPYTMAAILEMERWAVIFRMFAPRSALESFEFRGYKIPKGTMIITSGWAIHRDPKYWDNPNEYIPERFLETAENDGKDPSKLPGYAIFSFGKRNCPGETIAMMTIFLYFTAIMQKFNIKAPPGRRADLSGHSAAVIHPTKQELCFIER